MDNIPSLTPTTVKEYTDNILRKLLNASNTMDRLNFTEISVSDLELLFQQYNLVFFVGKFKHMLKPGEALTFSLSNRMTRAAGKTIRLQKSKGNTSFEIRISRYLLLHSFSDGDRPVQINGIPCGNRIEALQRVFEHELVHLIEMLKWQHSTCAKPRFRELAQQIFAHRATTHQLITSVERAKTDYNIVVGDMVKFRYKQQQLIGLVNRITKRATVLVEDQRGRRYSDGRYYSKYYVPVSHLRK